MIRNSRVYIFFLLLFASTLSYGQKMVADSVNKLLTQKLSDTSRILLQIRLSNAYNFYLPDSALIIIRETTREAQQLNFPSGEARALNVLGSVLRSIGELPKALESYFQALHISRTIHDREEETRSLTF